MPTIKELCKDIYNNTYKIEKERLENQFISASRKGKISEQNKKDIEAASQKEAIKRATVETMRLFPDEKAAVIWKAVYEIHVHRKSGIDNADIIDRVISADQSWKKSSGHAFEEMIKILSTETLKDYGIEILLKKDLNVLIKANKIANEPRDISWLKEQIKASTFDLYAIINKDGNKFCFGCIQSITSVRDRVTRGREPSLQAMQSYFWSTVVVLDGDFLKIPKFISMVTGGTPEHPTNGWHGLYVFSDQYTDKRIYPTDLDFKNFKEHAIKAADYWLTQRQWFDNTWIV